jgi:hypothetical protein
MGGVSLVALLAKRSFTSKKGVESAVFLKLPPSKTQLQLFGGNLTIDEFRKGAIRFDGTFCGEEPTVKRVRDEVVPPAFLDVAKISVAKCNTSGGNLVRPSDAGFFTGSSEKKRKSVASVTVIAPKIENVLSIREKMQITKKKRAVIGGFGGTTKTLDSIMGLKYVVKT